MGMLTEHQAPPDEEPGDAKAAELTREPRPDPVAWLIALATFAAYTILSVSRYLRLDPGSWDLGIFTEYVRQIAHLRPPVVAIRGAGFNLFGDHFSPVVGLLAPFFRLFPTPVTLLVAQSLLTAVSVVPVCRAARVRLGAGASRWIGAAYGASWGLQQMVTFDFHEIAFAVPLLAFSLSALVRRRPRAALLWAMPLVFVKEDQGFTLAVIGLLMVATGIAAHVRAHRAGTAPPAGNAAWAWAGLLLAGWGLGWSVAAIGWIIPHFNPAHQYPYWQNGGVVAPGAHLSVAAVGHQLAASAGTKLHTIYLVLLPVAFLALRSPLVLAAVPSLALRFVSTNTYFWGTDWHYSATVMPIVFLAAIDAMARVADRSAARAARARGEGPPGEEGPPPRRLPRPGLLLARYGGVVMAGTAAWLALQFPLASLGSAQTYQISAHVRAERAALARVPPGTTVEGTLSVLAPLAATSTAYWVGNVGSAVPAYVVFDQANSGYSPPPADVLAFVDQQHPGRSYQQIFARDSVYVFRLTGAATGG